MEYLYLFMMFSIVGWLWETPFVSIRNKKYVNRGFLFGPYIPIYGFAVVTIVVSMGIFARFNNNNIFIILLEMIFMGTLTALWEYFTSWGLEKIFNTRWWDYSEHKYNIQGRISFWVSVGFGLGAYFLWRFILPLFQDLYELIPNNFMYVIIIGFYAIFIIDTVFTLRDLFKLKKVTKKLEFLASKISEQVGIKLRAVKGNIPSASSKLTSSFANLKETMKKIIPANSSPNVKGLLKDFKETLDSYKPQRFIRKFPNSSNRTLNNIKDVMVRFSRKNNKDSK